MAGFQILDMDGNAIDIAELDRQAAVAWGKEVHPKQYANPSKREDFKSDVDYAFHAGGNWYDIIGWKIAYPQTNSYSGWKNVIYDILAFSLTSKFINDDLKLPAPVEVAEDSWDIDNDLKLNIIGTLLYANPYVQLIKYWASKGYTPQRVED